MTPSSPSIATVQMSVLDSMLSSMHGLLVLGETNHLAVRAPCNVVTVPLVTNNGPHFLGLDVDEVVPALTPDLGIRRSILSVFLTTSLLSSAGTWVILVPSGELAKAPMLCSFSAGVMATASPPSSRTIQMAHLSPGLARSDAKAILLSSWSHSGLGSLH